MKRLSSVVKTATEGDRYECGGRTGRARLLMSESATPVSAVNGCARRALASLAGRLRPLTAELRRGPRVTGNLAPIKTRTTLMNSSIEYTSQKVEAREVGNDERMQMLPKHFGREMLTVEYAIYAFMRKLASEYKGGYWTFFELSNGGFYIAPECEGAFNICVDTNGFEGTMSADAAGITACLFALSHLSFQVEDERIANHFHYLREFALSHAEAGTILAAID